MAMLPPIFNILKADPEVTALIGNPPRAYAHAAAPQQPVKPYVTWTVVGGDPQNNLSDLPDSDRVAFQVDVWHTDGAGVDPLATAVRDALEPYAHMTSILIDEREPATNLFRMAMQFDYWLMR
jgi:hypothetical protein